LAAQGTKPQEFESPNTKMRFRFIDASFPNLPGNLACFAGAAQFFEIAHE
jgi:hypothetical protein